jgi:putative transposase
VLERLSVADGDAGRARAHPVATTARRLRRAVRDWLRRVGVKTLFIEPGSPWENGYCESLNGKLRDELLDREIFYTLTEARVLIERWRRHYNTERPHSSLGYRPPAPETRSPEPCSASLRRALVQGAGLT